MHFSRKKLMALLMAGLCTISSLGMTGSIVKAEETTRVVMARGIDSATLDPAMASKNQDIWMMNFALEGLVRAAENGKDIEPALADTWEISEDNLTYKFHLREGVKFSNGEEVTPEDCIYSITRTRDKEGSPWQGMLSVIESVEKEGDDTIVVKVSQPTPALLSLLAMFPCSIMPQSYCEEVGDDQIANAPVGTGPFILTSWEKNSQMVFEKNPYYWQEGLPTVDEFVMTVVADENTRIMQLQSGQIDMTDVPLAQLDLVKADSNLVVDEFPSTAVDYIILNCANEKLEDVRVRQALLYATDREALNTALSFGYGKLADSFISPAAPHYNTNLPEITYDVEKAKELLAEAGYADGLDLRVDVGSGYSSELQEATMLKEQWAKAGVNLEIEQIDRATASSNWSAGDYEVYFSYLTSDMTDTSQLSELWCVSESTNCWGSGWHGEKQQEAEALVKEAGMEMDEEKRAELYGQMQEIVLEEVPNIPLYTTPFYVAHSKNIDNVKQNPLGNYRFEELTKTN